MAVWFTIETLSPAVRQVENIQNILALLQNLAVTELPKRYLWSATRRDNVNQEPTITHDEVKLEPAVPVIDLGGLFSNNQELKLKTVQEIGSACEEWGFIQVLNHGVPDKLFNEAASQARKFFQLPVEVKERAAYGLKARPFAGYRGAFSPSSANSPWLETISDHSPDMETSVVNSSWPEVDQGFCEVMDEVWAKMRNTGMVVLQALALHLGLPETSLSEQFQNSEDHYSCWRLNYYPKCPQPDRTLGVGPHSDPNLLTLLRSDLDGGLQVRKGNRWIDVPHVASSGTIVINIGDTLEAWTNGRYKSVEHRVQVNETTDRLSTVYAMTTLLTRIIEAPPELVDAEHPSLYRPFTYAEYQDLILKKGTVVGKSALDYVARETSGTADKAN